MVLKSASAGNVSVYQVAGTNVSRSLPDWIAKKRKRSLKNDLEYQSRIELIQDFEFSEASNRIAVTPDGQFSMATGTYKPQIHVYDFANLSLKFDRHTDSENVDFKILSEDWTKSVHLQNDRSIEFHTKGGIYYRTRIPKFGRSIAYNSRDCDLLVGASGNELYRLNLDQGRFLNPYKLESESGVNSVDISSVHGLISAGLEDGSVEFWDPRSRQRAAKLYVSDHLKEPCQVTATAFRNDGLNFACGSSTGMSLIYDLRSSVPTVVKDQGYGFDIKKIIWIDENKSATKNILTSDRRIAKIWDRYDGKPVTSMEPSVDINDIAYIPNSGMFLMANEGISMHSYYIPHIGPAPRWCSFLDNVTEELEEKPSDSIYSNYRFITRDDVDKLSLSHLIGSKVLRSYMHGFFIDSELYDKVNLIANPNSIRDQREREIRNRIEKERESRIRTSGSITNTKIKINRDLADRLQSKKGSDTAESVVNDDRFKELFENPEFAVDEESHEFKQLNPVRSTKDEENGGRKLTAAEESDEEREQYISGDNSDNSEEEEDLEDEVNEEKRERVKKELEKARRKREEREKTDKYLKEMKPINSNTIYNNGLESFGSQVDVLNSQQREKKNDGARLRHHVGGEAELTFVPRKEKKVNFKKPDHDNENDSEKTGRKKQRFEGRRRASKNAFRGM